MTRTDKKRVRIPDRTEIEDAVEKIVGQVWGKPLSSDELSIIDEFAREYAILPASLSFHSQCTYGLLYHSLNVAKTMRQLAEKENHEYPRPLVLITALMHDFDKVDTYTVRCVDCGALFSFVSESLTDYISSHRSHSQFLELSYNPVRSPGLFICRVIFTRLVQATSILDSFMTTRQSREIYSVIAKQVSKADYVCSHTEKSTFCGDGLPARLPDGVGQVCDLCTGTNVHSPRTT